MITLHHAIKITAARSQIYAALTDITQLASWHLGVIEGTIAPGEILTLRPNPHAHISWRTEKLVPDEELVQVSVDEPDSPAGKTLRITLADFGPDQTIVALSHGGWSDGDPHLPFCNTRWGEVLQHLKSWVEAREGENHVAKTSDLLS
ncbi:SRPBCC family protein [Pantoea sp. PGP6]